jgi:hypothetical protein
MEHTKFIALARQYKADQAENEYKFLELLVTQEEDVAAWKNKTPYKSWGELLREEGLCTITTYRNYKKARQLLSLTWIKRLGVYASISISKLDDDTRDKVLSSVKQWYSQHQVTPTYQRVSKYVRNLGGHVKKTKRENQVRVLKTYIAKCHALLKKNRIPLPQPSPI